MNLQEFITKFGSLPKMREMEMEYYLHVLKETEGNLKRAAVILGVTVKTIYNKLERWNISPTEARGGMPDGRFKREDCAL